MCVHIDSVLGSVSPDYWSPKPGDGHRASNLETPTERYKIRLLLISNSQGMVLIFSHVFEDVFTSTNYSRQLTSGKEELYILEKSMCLKNVFSLTFGSW